MGTCIKLVTTKSTNFCRTFEKVGKLRSYVVDLCNLASFFGPCRPVRKSISFPLTPVDHFLRFRRRRKISISVIGSGKLGDRRRVRSGTNRFSSSSGGRRIRTWTDGWWRRTTSTATSSRLVSGLPVAFCARHCKGLDIKNSKNRKSDVAVAQLSEIQGSNPIISLRFCQSLKPQIA